MMARTMRSHGHETEAISQMACNCCFRRERGATDADDEREDRNKGDRFHHVSTSLVYADAVPQRLNRFVQHRLRDSPHGKIVSFAAGGFALLIVFANIVQIHAAFGGRLSAPATWINDEISPLPIHTGLFVVMTTARPEIIIEGSDDGVHWREYTFKQR
jgi:hypothetical protein